MKTTINCIAAVLLAAGCAPGSSPIRVTGFFPYDPSGKDQASCKASSVGISSGSLDLAGAGSYHVVMRLDDEEQKIIINNARGDSLNEPGANNFISDSIYLTYVTTGTNKIALQPENLPYTGVLRPGSSDNFWGVNLIGPKTLAKLRDNFVDEITLLATVEIRGHTDASGTHLSSTPITYPIDIFQSTTTACTGANFLGFNGPCGGPGGQDGAPAICCTPGDANPACMPP